MSIWNCYWVSWAIYSFDMQFLVWKKVGINAISNSQSSNSTTFHLNFREKAEEIYRTCSTTFLPKAISTPTWLSFGINSGCLSIYLYMLRYVGRSDSLKKLNVAPPFNWKRNYLFIFAIWWVSLSTASTFLSTKFNRTFIVRVATIFEIFNAFNFFKWRFNGEESCYKMRP